ncbi:MAG: SocA family protein [Chlamydiae bacterium]|nr:SocA family protein [Chlamydiota bacterium]MBI3265634.1 SocA family protein [Chlamydiota bacterium]
MNISASQPPIRFKFDNEKFIACLTLLASKIRDLDKLKAVKLLYYADKYHLVRYGRPILGDVYFHLDYGPVPSKALDIINEAISPYKIPNIQQSNLELFKRYLKVNTQSKHPTFEPKKAPDLDCLSESEQESLHNTIQKYGHLSWNKLITSTHKEAPWNKSEKNGEIDYRLFFEDDKDANSQAIEYLEILQEHVDLVSLLASPT